MFNKLLKVKRNRIIIYNMRYTLELRAKKILSILLTILFFNWLVALLKIIYGISSHCSSMLADGYHSLFDGASNILGIIGIIIASQPKDINHPYGHKKYETFFSLGIAVLLFVVCFNLIKKGIDRLFNPIVPIVDLRSFIIMLLTLGINIVVMRYEKKKGRILQSDILISDALHTEADIFTSVSVIITLIAIKLGFILLDPIVTIIIALFIAGSGYGIIKQASAILCDTIAIVDVKKIEEIVLSIKGIKSCHKIRTRGRADDINLDLHVQIDPRTHIDKAHQISYAIEEAIKKNIPQITDIVVHIEPKED